MKYILLMAYLLLSSSGLILVKLGGPNTIVSLNINKFMIQTDWKILLGGILYILSFLFWMIVVNKFDLSYIYPVATGVLFIIIMVSSIVFLKETISLSQIIGAIIILVGIAISNIKF